MTKQQIDQYLYALLGSHEMVKLWWESQNAAFDEKTPESVWKVSSQQVLSYVLGQNS